MIQLQTVFLLLLCSCFLEVEGLSIRPVPCTNPLTGENGVCTFHWFCINLAHGTHIGFCMDRFLIGTCCKIPSNNETKLSKHESIQIQMDNSTHPMVKKEKVEKLTSIKSTFHKLDHYFMNVHLKDSHKKPSEVLFDKELNISHFGYRDHPTASPVNINPVSSASFLQFLFSPKNTRLETIKETKNKWLSSTTPTDEIQTKMHSDVIFPKRSTSDYGLDTGSHLSVLMGYISPVTTSTLIDNFRKPLSFHENHNLRQPVAINEQHNLRKPVSLNEAHDQRWPVIEEDSRDQRKPVLEEESRDQRRPVLYEDSHDQRWPVLEEDSHDQRWPELEEDSRDQLRPVLEEYSQDQQSLVPEENSFNQKFSTFSAFLQKKNTSNVNYHPLTTEYSMLETNTETEANDNSEISHNFSSQWSEQMNLEDFVQQNLPLVEGTNDGDHFLSMLALIFQRLHQKSQLIDIQPISNQKVIPSDVSQVCGKPVVTTTARIVGGRKSHYLQWPWMISLLRYEGNAYKHKCGAALLNHLWAVTAAHCVYGKFSLDAKLRVGEFSLNEDDEEHSHLERLVDVAVIHPNFDPISYENDIALLRFIEPVRFQANVIPICLPHVMDDITGRMAIVTGWGRLSPGGELPTSLHEVQVPILSNEECEQLYLEAGFAETIKDIFVCAGLSSGGLDACEGDSGGPLMVRGDEGQWVLVGLISWGMGCAAPKQPGVYTRISKYTHWIERIISH